MPTYNFKRLHIVPSSTDLIDIVLSKTQRQTPTVVHNGWAIQRIRQFYMRKVKYTQSTLHDKLAGVLESFPKVDDVHPFYADLLNVLYDRDHYKLALGQLRAAQNLVDKIAKDYVRLLKYGDSLYRCKQLKRAALGRMCTLIKKQGPSLAYMEQVRQHMSRLPSIDPNTRTILVCGYPNVGKSSFMNKVTRAEVEVEPYAFTTKSLYVGHTDYKYLRWQVIDTPGILDRPLEERNTIEMQSITALAHLRAVVLYIVDISEHCGYSIEQQAALFHSIKPLFANKPLLVVCNKIDVQSFEGLSAEDQEHVNGMKRAAALSTAGSALGMVDGLSDGGDEVLLTMSTLAEQNIGHVKEVACERLLAARVEQKLRTRAQTSSAMNKLHVATPGGGAARDRPPVIPEGVEAARRRRAAGEKPRTELDLQEENGGAGVYSYDMRKNYLLEDDAWKHDVVPEIYNGHNVADFIDPDIEERLAELEREEEQAEREWAEEEAGYDYGEDLTEEEQEQLRAIRARKKAHIAEHRLKKKNGANNPVMPRTADRDRTATVSNLRRSLNPLGLDTSKVEARVRERGRSVTRKRLRSGSEAPDGDVDMEEGGGRSRSRSKRAKVLGKLHSSRSRSRSRGPSVVAERKYGSGMSTETQKMRAQILADKAQRKMNMRARKGEADRHIPDLKPKHLNSGKRGNGKTDWR